MREVITEKCIYNDDGSFTIENYCRFCGETTGCSTDRGMNGISSFLNEHMCEEMKKYYDNIGLGN